MFPTKSCKKGSVFEPAHQERRDDFPAQQGFRIAKQERGSSQDAAAYKSDLRRRRRSKLGGVGYKTNH